MTRCFIQSNKLALFKTWQNILQQTKHLLSIVTSTVLLVTASETVESKTRAFRV